MKANHGGSDTPDTMPFRPHIFGDGDFDDDKFYLDTGLVVVAPDRPVTKDDFGGADKVMINVARPDDLEKLHQVSGEFVGSSGYYEEVSIAIFKNNEVSTDLGFTSVTVPLRFIAKIISRYAGAE